MLRIEFHRPDAPEAVVGRATWDGRAVSVEGDGPEVRTALARVFRPAPVVSDDPALRNLGARGEVVLQPGGLDWFLQAARVRGPEVGLAGRVVRPEVEGGWDPAGNYRTFDQQVERLAADP
jgi:hypothetical protein